MDNQSTCKNCDEKLSGKYCSNCGQAVFSRFSISYLWSLLHQDLFEIDRGLWRTFKDLMIQPGYMVRDFLNGKTKTYFSPLKYLLIAVALFYLVVSVESLVVNSDQSEKLFWEWRREYFFNNHPAFSPETVWDFTHTIPVVMSKGLTLYFLVLIPFLAFGCVLVFKRYNFTEYLITLTFMWGHVIILIALLTFLLILVELFITATIISTVLLSVLSIGTFILWILMFRQLHALSWAKAFFKFVLALYGSLIPFYIILILIFMVLKALLV